MINLSVLLGNSDEVKLIMPETRKDWLQKDRVHANCKAMPPSIFYETKMSILRKKKKDLLKITNKERKTLI